MHLIVISLVLVVFTVLKNFDFEDYRNSPDLSTNQVRFLYIFLFAAIIGIFLLFIRGYFVKTPYAYTRAGIAMVFIVVGVVIIFGMLLHDDILGSEQEIGSMEMLGILFGSLITGVGSIAYISIKFPDETMMKYFKQAVKEEIRKRGEEERQWRILQAKQRREQRKQVRATKKPTAAKAGRAGKPKLHKVEMVPPEEAGVAVVKCSKCQRSLKVTSPERPLTIKCPYCEAIGVIKE